MGERWRLVAIGAVAVLAACGGGGGSKATAPTTTTSAAPITYPPTSYVAPNYGVAVTVPPFPKEVPVSSITDARVRNWATQSDRSITVVVEVAPGVYASRGHGASLGSVDDYKGVFGLCADVHPFEQEHRAGGTCW